MNQASTTMITSSTDMTWLSACAFGIAPSKGILHMLGCTIAAPVAGYALLTNRAVGAGVGGSFALGALVGISGALGFQIVADPSKNVGLTFTGSGTFPGPVLGAGAQVGGQISISTSRNIHDLEGDAVDVAAGAGVVGVDVSKNPRGGPYTATLTLGPGVGGKVFAVQASHTILLTSTNCGDQW